MTAEQILGTIAALGDLLFFVGLFMWDLRTSPGVDRG